MANATDRTRQVWLHLLRSGGWWSVTELLAQNRAWREFGTHLGNAMRNLHKSGCCQRRLAEGGLHYEYCVTPQCTVLQGVTLLELMETIH